ncbi:putative cytochrome P450 [Xylariaceae sp. FL0594]|nr:putative cytochrome P450 [Xylariaceae sp. FL0594]
MLLYHPAFITGATRVYPICFNAYQYLTDMESFLKRAEKSGVIGFRLGRKAVYIVSGTSNVHSLFAPPHIMDPNMFHMLLMDKHWGMPSNEIRMFAKNTSGGQKRPLPGTEGIPDQRRPWHNHHEVYAQYLSSSKYTEALADTFFSFFLMRLDQQPLLECVTVPIFDLIKTDRAESAVASLFGTQLLYLNPGLIECYWEFDEIAGALVRGLPRFLKPGQWRIRERLHNMVHRHVTSAWEKFNWEKDGESDWDPHSRFSREIAKWLRQTGFSDRATIGHTTATLLGQEVLQAFTNDHVTGRRNLDVHRLLTLPRLSSAYLEILRLHVSFNVTREVQQDTEVSGYRIPKGSLLQAPSQIAHYDESAWASEGHPASEFWAERHLTNVDEAGRQTTEPRLSTKSRPTSFFPFGPYWRQGLGYALCPGRHSAKREILMAVAVILAKFEVEFVQWVHSDGRSSSRPAQNDQGYAGVVAMLPDRDMLVRWKRLW